MIETATDKPAKTPWKRLLFEDIPNGQLDRRAFARGLIGLAAMLGLALVVFQAHFHYAESFSEEGMVRGLAVVVQLAGYVIAAVFATVIAVLAAAGANLVAKRLRHIGLPGWHALAVLCVLGTAFSLGAPAAAALGYVAVIWAALFFMPSLRPRRRG